MPDEQTDKVDHRDGDYLYSDPEIFKTTYNFQRILGSHFIKRMETSAEDAHETANNSRRRRRSDSNGSNSDSDLVVVSVLLNKKQKENDEVAMAIERLRKNGVNCVFFTMNDIRNGNLKSDTKVADALQGTQSFVTPSQVAPSLGSPGLPKLTPIVTNSKSSAASAQVSEITSTLTTPTLCDTAAQTRSTATGQKSPDITDISSTSCHTTKVSQSCNSRPSLAITAAPAESSVSSTPKLTRNWEEAPPSITATAEIPRSRSITPPPPVLSPQVVAENSSTDIEAISEAIISSCEKIDEEKEKPKKKRRKRRQSFFYRSAPKKKKMCPFAQAAVKGALNLKKELEESVLTSQQPLLEPEVNEKTESVVVDVAHDEIIQEVAQKPKRGVRKSKINEIKPELVEQVQSVQNGVIHKRVNGILKKDKTVQQNLEAAIEKSKKAGVKSDGELSEGDGKLLKVAERVQKTKKVIIHPETIVKDGDEIGIVATKPEIVGVKVERKRRKVWRGKRARSRKKKVKPLIIKLNGGYLRAFSPDITAIIKSSLSLPPLVNCVQSISGKLDVQDDDKSIEDVQLKVDEIVKALESETESSPEDESVNRIVDCPCPFPIFEEKTTKDFPPDVREGISFGVNSNLLLSDEPVEASSSTNKETEEHQPPITIKDELEDQKPALESTLNDIKSDSIPDSPDAMQLRRSSFYSLISGNVRTNLENYMDGRCTTLGNKTPSKRRKRVKNGFLLHHGDNYPDDPESPYKLHLATQVLLKLNKRRAKFKPKEDRGKSLLSYLKLAPKRSPRIGKVQGKSQEEQEKVTNSGEPLFSGEWSLPRKFVCNICSHSEDCFWDLVHHKGENHPGVLATHVELTHPTPFGLIRKPPETELNYDPPPCTKCSQKFSTFPDLHRHIFECAGNAAWLEEKTTRKKKAKRRRGFKRRLSNTPKKANNGKKAETTPKRRHSEVFKCEFCTREFKTEGWLKNHLVTHSLPVSIPLEKLSPLSRASLTSYRHVSVK